MTAGRFVAPPMILCPKIMTHSIDILLNCDYLVVFSLVVVGLVAHVYQEKKKKTTKQCFSARAIGEREPPGAYRPAERNGAHKILSDIRIGSVVCVVWKKK